MIDENTQATPLDDLQLTELETKLRKLEEQAKQLASCKIFVNGAAASGSMQTGWNIVV